LDPEVVNRIEELGVGRKRKERREKRNDQKEIKLEIKNEVAQEEKFDKAVSIESGPTLPYFRYL
jgi:hypothetical protein